MAEVFAAAICEIVQVVNDLQLIAIKLYLQFPVSSMRFFVENIVFNLTIIEMVVAEQVIEN